MCIKKTMKLFRGTKRIWVNALSFTQFICKFYTITNTYAFGILAYWLNDLKGHKLISSYKMRMKSNEEGLRQSDVIKQYKAEKKLYHFRNKLKDQWSRIKELRNLPINIYNYLSQ